MGFLILQHYEYLLSTFEEDIKNKKTFLVILLLLSYLIYMAILFLLILNAQKVNLYIFSLFNIDSHSNQYSIFSNIFIIVLIFIILSIAYYYIFFYIFKIVDNLIYENIKTKLGILDSSQSILFLRKKIYITNQISEYIEDLKFKNIGYNGDIKILIYELNEIINESQPFILKLKYSQVLLIPVLASFTHNLFSNKSTINLIIIFILFITIFCGFLIFFHMFFIEKAYSISQRKREENIKSLIKILNDLEANQNSNIPVLII